MLGIGRRSYIVSILSMLVTLLLLRPVPVQAQSPIVYGIFFYSPTCPHCHEVINNHWPGISSEFGDQLKVLFVDVTTSEGGQIMRTAINAMRIQSNAVPMLIIGSDVLIGSGEIPARAPDVIRAGISAGGIGYPPIPNIDIIFQSVLPVASLASTEVASRSLLDDPANIAALVVLVGLVVALIIIGIASWRYATQGNQHLINSINGLLGRRMAFAGVVIGIGLSASLILGSVENLTTLLISVAVLAAFVILAFYLFQTSSLGQLSSGLLPLIVVAGILVAGYLTYVELTLVEATCGVIGDCNTVQQSPYARILGIPIGIIGIVGYFVMLTLWMMKRFKKQSWIDGALFMTTVFGVSFSIYLTLLEPFVIGATCVWCLTSAVIMGILLWMTAPAGWEAMLTMLRPPPKEQHRKFV